jgi:hypothetical protein
VTQPPRSIDYAAIALIVTGVFGVIAGLVNMTSSTKQWLFTVTKKADQQASDVKSGKTKMPTDASIHHAINSSGVPILLITVVVALGLAYVASSLRKGKYWTRWGVLGSFALLTLFIRPPGGGLTGLLGVSTDAPVAYRGAAFISSLAMLVAVVATNLRPSLAFLARSRPEGKARGGLFAPRPPLTPKGATGKVRSNNTNSNNTNSNNTKVTTTKPATTRAANKTVDNRQRGKARVDVTAPEPKPRARGKSRRTNVDDKTT